LPDFSPAMCAPGSFGGDSNHLKLFEKVPSKVVGVIGDVVHDKFLNSKNLLASEQPH